MNSEPVTGIEPVGAPEGVATAASVAEATWMLGLLQAGDSYYPTGSYAHSFGLEGLVEAGVVRDRATLREFLLLSVLPSLRQADLPLTAQAWHALGAPDWTAVGELCQLASALKAPRELRAASEAIGRQRAEMIAALRGHPLAREFLSRAAAEHWPCSATVSAALEGRVLGAPLPAVLSGVCYASVGAVLAAAMKILRIGQNASQALLTEALRLAPELIADAAVTPVAEIGWFNPWLDIASARHETANARLFIS